MTDPGSEDSIRSLVVRSWQMFDDAIQGGLPVIATSVPVVWFGDLEAYRRSPSRIITAALNPSKAEFPDGDSGARFPGARRDDVAACAAAYSRYFVHNPYRGWFRHFEALLVGMQASFYPGKPSTVLHTDLCSPLATDPTFSKLHPRDQEWLRRGGLPHWNDLVAALDPHIIVLSGGLPLRALLPSEAPIEWTHHSGHGRKRVDHAHAVIGGKLRCVVFGITTNTPFGAMTYGEREQVGRELSGLWFPR